MSQYEKSLKKLIEGLEITDINGSMDVLIDGISIDSRTVREKDLYACVPGFNVDGHDYAPEAVKAGASALLVEKILPLEIPQVKVSNVREMIGQIAARFYDYPASRLNLVGVTGTNGKTTITHLIEKIGIYGNKKVGLIGTMGARINGRDIPGDRTTPEAADVQRLLAEMVSEKVSLAVMEVSSHALDLGRVNGSEFDAAIFTNLTQDHLDYHKTMEEYLKAKARLFESLRGEKKPKISIINNDDNAYAYLKNVSASPLIP